MDIDESLYSRQLYVMGHEAQRKMAASSVLIAGLNGLGVEVAKNVILAGVKSVALFDEQEARFEDLSAQFYLTEADIGKNRAAVSATKLAELNPYVPVSVHTGDLSPLSIASNYSVVVLIDQPLSKQLELSSFCHSNGIKVIIGDAFGVFGQIFCDFGADFVVHDVNGEPAAQSMVSSITMSNPAVVTVLEDTRHNLDDGDVVSFSDIIGMSELNGKEFKVSTKGDAFSFEIDVDSTQFSPYERSGFINQVKQPVTVSFNALSESIKQPGEFICDFVKMWRVPQMHFAFQALHQYRSLHQQQHPQPGNMQHAEEIFNTAVRLNAAAAVAGDFSVSAEDMDAQKDAIIRFALGARGQVSPICALLGGILGQEVLKACSGKFMPIKQWFYYDASETLHEKPLSVEEVSPVGSRYDGQIMVYGKEMQQQLQQLKMFLVGAGAIGCEMLKNWAMMGVSCSSNSSSGGSVGKAIVTDMDSIEKSNLSRQFLFRNSDINAMKSATAVRAVQSMNPAFTAVAFDSKVAPDTDDIFDDDFFEQLDMVCTALDNVEARLFIDQKCLFYQLPMLESGTLGPKGHTQVVAPFLTENYGATRDPPEKTIPVCTLKHFPNKIDHTLQWARDWFEEVFKQTPEDVNSYLTSSDFNAMLEAQQNMRLEILKRVEASLISEHPDDFSDCVAWARRCFQDLFCNRVKQLLYNFPLDRMTSSGTPFWSGAKRPPTAIEFDPSDTLHAEFVTSTAVLRAQIFGVTLPVTDTTDAAFVAGVAQQAAAVSVEPFRPQEGVRIAATDEEAKANAAESKTAAPVEDFDAQCARLTSALPAPSAALAVAAVEFDKDVDSHMRAVAAASNLRARNYSIPEADLHTSRGIAGKITPAIATTTALVTGTICLEIYKLLLKKPVTQLHNTFANIAVPIFTSQEPEPPKSVAVTVKGEAWKWNQWDRIDISDPGMTIGGLVEYLEQKYSLELSMLSTGVTILYSDFMNPAKLKERKSMTLKQALESVAKKVIGPKQKYMILELIVNDVDSGEEVEIPYVRFKLH